MTPLDTLAGQIRAMKGRLAEREQEAADLLGDEDACMRAGERAVATRETLMFLLSAYFESAEASRARWCSTHGEGVLVLACADCRRADAVRTRRVA